MTPAELAAFSLATTKAALRATSIGFRVDMEQWQASVDALQAELGPLEAQIQDIVLPLLPGSLTPKEQKLFQDKWTCTCCKGGAKKALACWSCAGLTKAPTKKQAEENPLGPCAECQGVGRGWRWVYNPASDTQTKLVLYALLKLPKRFKDKKLTADENALKGLVAQDDSGLVDALLVVNKHRTMVKKYENIRPGPDGRIRTFMNPAGTITMRMSHRGGKPFPTKVSERYALEVSTNLGNVPGKRQVLRNPLYSVRHCMVPDPGHVLIEGDLSQAEARIVAALCGDTNLLDAWKDPEFDVHKYTASLIYRVPVTEVTKNQRARGKPVRHASNYGMGPKTYQSGVNGDADITGVSITYQQAQADMLAYKKANPKLEPWWQAVNTEIARTGGITNCFGFKATFHQKRRGDGWLDMVHRAGIAQNPQSTVPIIINLGWLDWNAKHLALGEVLVQVHDALVVQAPVARQREAMQALKAVLERPIIVNGYELTIPVDISVSATSWGEMEEVEEL